MILAAGLSPAWQQVLRFDTFTPGTVNRAAEAHWCASGKVLNAARALHHLGGPCRALTVAGGPAGDALRRDFARLGVPARWVEVAAPTRVCTTIVDTARHTSTELVENAHGLTPAELDAFITAYSQEVTSARVVVLIGSLPPGTPAGFFRGLLERTTARVILDARGAELLHALPARPFLVKPNREELAATLGRELPTDAALFDAMHEINRRGAEWVLVTDGKDPTHVSSTGRVWRVVAPTREVVNPIGCGDCLVGGFAWATFHGRGPLDAARFGVAVAADKVGQLLPGSVDRARVEALAELVDIHPV